MPPSPVTGSDLETYRKNNKLSQVAIGEMLGVSGPTVNRWEKDEDQEIPETAQKLLRMLIYGEMPFGPRDPQAEELESKHFWQLKLSLADWHKLEGLAMAGGFPTVRDYLFSMIQEDLQREREGKAKERGWSEADTRTRGEGAVDEMAMVAEEAPGDGDVGATTGSALDAAAAAFAAANPVSEPPRTEASGDSAGSARPRRDVRYTRAPRQPNIPRGRK